MIPENLKIPHIETNDDGHQFHHPGYCEIKCLKCGKFFIIANTTIGAIHGDPKCGKGERNTDGKVS